MIIQKNKNCLIGGICTKCVYCRELELIKTCKDANLNTYKEVEVSCLQGIKGVKLLIPYRIGGSKNM